MTTTTLTEAEAVAIAAELARRARIAGEVDASVGCCPAEAGRRRYLALTAAGSAIRERVERGDLGPGAIGIVDILRELTVEASRIVDDVLATWVAEVTA